MDFIFLSQKAFILKSASVTLTSTFFFYFMFCNVIFQGFIIVYFALGAKQSSVYPQFRIWGFVPYVPKGELSIKSPIKGD